MNVYLVEFGRNTGHQIEPYAEVARIPVEASSKAAAVMKALDVFPSLAPSREWDSIHVRKESSE